MPAITISGDLISDEVLHAYYTTVGAVYVEGEDFTISLGPAPDGRISVDVQTGDEDGLRCRNGKMADFKLTADQVNLLAVALVRMADETDRLAARSA
jgi:hypothetical protein